MRAPFSLLVVWGLLLAHAAVADSGMPFLRLDAGARGTALAGATVALRDVEAIAVNPAALQARERSSIGLTHGAWIRDIRHDYLSLVFAGRRSVWGVGAQIAQADDLERRVGPTREPLGRFGVYDGALVLAYARDWTPVLRLGLGVKLLRQAIGSETASGAALDLGLLYAWGERLQLGASLRNLGGMTELARAVTPLPSAVHLGCRYTALGGLALSAEVQRDRDGDGSAHLGAEYAVAEWLTLRGGYQTADSRDLAAGVGLAAGRWSVDYAFTPFASGLGEAHRLSVRLHR